ncbi:MAG: hypothetical protein O7F76_02250, partial [Planctomycetota bacterium]|nr:hypothetical protein [Planctomycetota bacterium]
MIAASTDRMKSCDKDVAPGRVSGQTALSENANRVLEARYLEKNEAGQCTETPDDLFKRVAKTIADVETRYG